jgi:hypothetical protein
MRALALLLLIANLGYFGWATLIDTDTAPASVPTPDSQHIPRLVLASERAPSKVKEPSRVAAAKPAAIQNDSPAVSGEQKCVSIGPFQDLPTVVEASALLKGTGYESRQRLEQGEPTHDRAEQAVTRLKDKGITDAYILPGTDPPNVISLGVFKEHDRAQRRYTEAKNLGFDVQIADRTRAGSVYWIDVDFKNAKQSPDTSILGSKPGKIVRLEERPCPANPNG